MCDQWRMYDFGTGGKGGARRNPGGLKICFKMLRQHMAIISIWFVKNYIHLELAMFEKRSY